MTFRPGKPESNANALNIGGLRHLLMSGQGRVNVKSLIFQATRVCWRGSEFAGIGSFRRQEAGMSTFNGAMADQRPQFLAQLALAVTRTRFCSLSCTFGGGKPANL
jgi:hypothetical protein